MPGARYENERKIAYFLKSKTMIDGTDAFKLETITKHESNKAKTVPEQTPASKMQFLVEKPYNGVTYSEISSLAAQKCCTSLALC